MTKKRVLKIIKKYKKMQQMERKINQEIEICHHLRSLNIFNSEEFFEICNLLKIDYVKDTTINTDTRLFTAYYDDLEIVTVILGDKK